MRPPTYRPRGVPGLPAPSLQLLGELALRRNTALGRLKVAIVKGEQEVEVSQSEWTTERASTRVAELREILRHTRSADVQEAVRRAIADVEKQQRLESDPQEHRSLLHCSSVRARPHEAGR